MCSNGSSQVVLEVKNPPANSGDPRDVGSMPGSGRTPGGEHGNLLQYSCLEHSMDRKAWQAMIHGGCKESDMTEQVTLSLLSSAALQACFMSSSLYLYLVDSV